MTRRVCVCVCVCVCACLPLGEWAHHLRVFGDEGRVHNLVLNEVTAQLMDG